MPAKRVSCSSTFRCHTVGAHTVGAKNPGWMVSWSVDHGPAKRRVERRATEPAQRVHQGGLPVSQQQGKEPYPLRVNRRR